ncbi:LLM class flavin-dependent oxidoreductase [Streptomyces buecherae]|uniref:LLM class flavin-dependent oxidoreductase n=1 Tax=Streptomyces buecherae TaxID=2763006 RepID=UPI0036657578
MTNPLARPRVGVVLPSLAAQREQKIDFADAARHAEDVGLDLVAYGGRLAGDGPAVEAAVALAAVAAATERLRICSGALAPADRPLAWAARQIASLAHVAGDRLVLGVDGYEEPARGGAPGEPGVWLDTALALLPRLLAGERVHLPDGTGAVGEAAWGLGQAAWGLGHAVPGPQVWVGGTSPAAIRRVVRSADGWFPSLVSPDEVAAGVVRLAERAVWRGRPAPTVAVGVVGALGGGPELPGRGALAARVAAARGVAVDALATAPVVGGAREAAERLHAYWGAGARHVVVGFADGDWRAQVDVLAEARALLG